MLTAIIVAAGRSRRAGFDKIAAKIAGKSVLVHAVDAFEGAPSVTEILVVTRDDRLAELKNLLRGKNKVKGVIAGGEHRQDSVKAGLAAVSQEARYVAVHDAARPLVTHEQIESVFLAARDHGAAALAEPITDTLKRVDAELRVIESIDRRQLFAMQTPQIFARDLLEQAYRAVFAKGLQITDEVSAVEHLGKPVRLVANAEPNFKITFERDLPVADFVMRARQSAA
jgi:2-C-methyl-D-erythritol 4-phosphate cytidylyltransferase